MAEGDPGSAGSGNPTRQGKIVVSVATFLGTIMIELADGLPTSLPQVLLLVGGAALIGLLAGGAVLGALQWILRQIRGTRRMLTVLSVGLTLALVFVTGPPVLQLLRHKVFGCDQATELTVLTSPSGLDPSTLLIDRYEQWTAERNGGCATVNAYVYPAAAADSRTAISQGWVSDEQSKPLRDIGPRPDVWLPDSDYEVKLLDEQIRRDHVARNEEVARSPVVLGVPAAAAANLRQDNWSWPELFAAMMASGIGVVRPDPQVSLVGAVATAALYGTALDDDGWTSGPPTREPRAVEQWIERSLDLDSYQVKDSLELLCRHRQLSEPQAAVILSEQDLIRFNRGSPLGAECGAPNHPRPPEKQMIAFYPRTIALDHRFVEFTWNQPGSRQTKEVAKLRAWLTGEQGHQAFEEVGLRAPDASPTSALFAEQGARPNARFDTVVIEPAKIEGTLQAFREAQRRSRVLLVLDVSGSMAEPAPPDPGTRLSLVVQGIGTALPSVQPRDELGLWLFPGDAAGNTINQAVPVQPADKPHTQAVSDTLARATPSGNTPLFRAVVDGVAALDQSDDTIASKLVVITDGKDTTSNLAPDQVLNEVRDRNVRVFVIAIGGISCEAAPLAALGEITGGKCYSAAPSQVSRLLSEIITS